ncbi:EAL domain-containing protein [Plasticicumulans sp.]|uniref:EAL domain-containing protein n=1 Tax=Plasticicumulans sp. TaxID=2307179 RepID=UPI002B90E59B|nr:EAL domain-containing protein [Plasticicumulans sp.]MBS0603018.1 EAL domain-containing protein [Pseudomonadota bacterium]HMW28315.1 EAL domain-containing protein [Plasticicumulans sp.]HMX52694.1 EAL domain-containing protein [Plasticicumulans sp.]HMZ09086.1 EAL domain-containing protein [Plasticicumulans sp.]HNB89796.1 EAL domain-containing protein [Plasticicumulans sp.]
MSLDSTIRLLLVDRPQADAQPVLRPLRAAGFLVRHWQADRIDTLQHLIDEQTFDLAIVRIGEGVLPIENVRDSIDSAFKDIPVIAVADETAGIDAVQLLNAGADRIAALNHSNSLPLVARLELGRLNERRQARRWEGLYREAEARAQALLETSRDAIAYIHAGAHIYTNPSYRALFGFDDALVDTTLIDLIHRDSRDAVKSYLRARERNPNAPLGDGLECRGVRADGSEIRIVLLASAARMNEEFCLQLLVREPRGEQPEVQDKLRYFVEHDTLTGLFNRQYFTELLNRIHTSATTSGSLGGAVLYVLMTDYRGVAERLGLEAVDDLLRGVAEAIQQQVGPQEIVARFSDATFTVHTPLSARGAVAELGERVRQGIENHTIQAGGMLITAKASIGICMIGDTNSSATQIISYADKACEQARQLGGSQVQIYTPVAPERDSIARRDTILRAFRQAVVEQRVHLYYQPIASFTGARGEFFDACLSASDEQGQPLDLREALPLAETRGLMRQLDRWTVATALAAIAARGAAGAGLPTVFVRVSSNSITDAEYRDWLLQQLAERNLPGSVLVLEVAETVVEPYFADLIQLKQAVEPRGCRIALDGFGGRPYSEQLLRQSQPGFVRIDIELMEQAQRDAAFKQQLDHLTALAAEQHTQVIMTGVDNPAQMAITWQFGAMLVQGDIVQPPAPELVFDFSQFG